MSKDSPPVQPDPGLTTTLVRAAPPSSPCSGPAAGPSATCLLLEKLFSRVHLSAQNGGLATVSWEREPPDIPSLDQPISAADPSTPASPTHSPRCCTRCYRNHMGTFPRMKHNTLEIHVVWQCTCLCACTCACMHMHVHVCARACADACAHASMCMCVWMCACIMHTMYVHACVRAHVSIFV